jgi:hypothetical protein
MLMPKVTINMSILIVSDNSRAKQDSNPISSRPDWTQGRPPSLLWSNQTDHRSDPKPKSNIAKEAPAYSRLKTPISNPKRSKRGKNGEEGRRQWGQGAKNHPLKPPSLNSTSSPTI